MVTAWESQLADFLRELSAVQDQTMDVLARRRALLAAWNEDGAVLVARHETELIERLKACVQRREGLLRQAKEEGRPAQSIQDLAGSLPAGPDKRELTDRIRQSGRRAKLLQHSSFTNWVVAQRILLHLSRILEIIATGGRLQPTYGKEATSSPHGALVDQEV
jgi:hypothetical protein